MARPGLHVVRDKGDKRMGVRSKSKVNLGILVMTQRRTWNLVSIVATAPVSFPFHNSTWRLDVDTVDK